MTLIEIGIPQISDGCPYKVVNSQWVPTSPEAMMKNEQMNETFTEHYTHMGPPPNPVQTCSNLFTSPYRDSPSKTYWPSCSY